MRLFTRNRITFVQTTGAIPDAFTFTDTVNAELSTPYTASTTITGLTEAAPVSVSGGYINIAGGGWVTQGQVANGQTLQVRVTAPSTYTSSASAVVTVSGVSATYTVSTIIVPAVNKGFLAGSSGSVIRQLKFSTEVFLDLGASAVLNVAQGINMCGISGLRTGYFCGGGNSGTYTSISGLDYVSATSFTPSAVLSVGRYNGAGLASQSKGYICGGAGSVAAQTAIDGLGLFTGAAFSLGAAVAASNRGYVGLNKETSHGYLGAWSATVNTITKFPFVTETVSACSATLSSMRYGSVEWSGLTDGYFSGGMGSSGAANNLDSLIFASDTRVGKSGGLARASTNCGMNSTGAGYSLGGIGSSGAANETASKYTFASNTHSTLASGGVGGSLRLRGISAMN